MSLEGRYITCTDRNVNVSGVNTVLQALQAIQGESLGRENNMLPDRFLRPYNFERC